ncbi:carbamate kinase [Methanomassiliicoccus luminyensis]|uniref:carbamate kinase n=1 Tax=Methanomassiliicoccus luminyensis TaxID=1080712 RepID=UPI00036C0785|nr:carbamate kinase [Methanomassiliicoccus luminyensis]
MTTILVAVGGNAILGRGQKATLEDQMGNLRATSAQIARLVRDGHEVVLTHGNGPQVGSILLQNELAAREVPPMPLDACVAESQGLIGYMMQQTLTEALRSEGCRNTVTCVLTRVLVDEADEAFKAPSKPIGPYYREEEARTLRDEKGWVMVEDRARGGWRRVVPSPRPVSIVEASAIHRLVSGGDEVVIAAGGGGVPVVERGGRLEGVEAVVDKDLSAACLARSARASLMVFLTDVEQVYLDYGTARQRPISSMTADEAEKYLREGQFPPGTMGPKIEAAVRFLRSGGKRALIAQPQCIHKALASKAGTQILPR